MPYNYSTYTLKPNISEKEILEIGEKYNLIKLSSDRKLNLIKKLLRDYDIKQKDIYIYSYRYTPIYGYVEQIKSGNLKDSDLLGKIEEGQFLEELDTILYEQYFDSTEEEKNNILAFANILEQSHSNKSLRIYLLTK